MGKGRVGGGGGLPVARGKRQKFWDIALIVSVYRLLLQCSRSVLGLSSGCLF